ncbi:MAG: hypothetical protein MK319_06300, partial [Pseudomonadales bacterium]|nr:hypothetical protein [Pseudomonadales bacterium]
FGESQLLALSFIEKENAYRRTGKCVLDRLRKLKVEAWKEIPSLAASTQREHRTNTPALGYQSARMLQMRLPTPLTVPVRCHAMDTEQTLANACLVLKWSLSMDASLPPLNS